MIVYVLKSVCCAFFFLTMYHFLIEKDKVLKFRRFFLLGSLLFSLLIPVVSIPQSTVSLLPMEEIESMYVLSSSDHDATLAHTVQDTVEPTFSWIYIVVGIYLLVTSFLLIRFVYNLFRVTRMSRGKPSIMEGRVKIVLENDLLLSFSFFNTIFISKHDYQDNHIRSEILIHELVHVKQKHSADVLLIELLIIFLWFNPVLYLYRRAIKLNHEFLADEGVINSTRDVYTYQRLLISRAACPCMCSLTSNLTYLITKKRLIMMTKTTSKRSFLLKLTVLIPAFLLATGLFSSKMLAEANMELPIGQIIGEQVSSVVDNDIVKPGDGITAEEMDQYSNIVSKYLDKAIDGKVTWKTNEISEEDERLLFPLYIQMTKEQRRQQLIKFLSPFTPFMLRSPNVDEWRGCTNRDLIYLDGKIIDRKTAETYNRKDMVFFITTRKSGKAYMWTKKGYDAYMDQYGEQIPLAELLQLPLISGFTTGYKDKTKVVVNGRFE